MLVSRGILGESWEKAQEFDQPRRGHLGLSRLHSPGEAMPTVLRVRYLH